MTIEERFEDWERKLLAVYLDIFGNPEVEDSDSDYLTDSVLPSLVDAIVGLRSPKTIGDLLGWETEPLKWAGLEYLVRRDVQRPDEFADVWEWDDLLLVPDHATFDGRDIAAFMVEHIEEEEEGGAAGKLSNPLCGELE